MIKRVLDRREALYVLRSSFGGYTLTVYYLDRPINPAFPAWARFFNGPTDDPATITGQFPTVEWDFDITGAPAGILATGHGYE